MDLGGHEFHMLFPGTSPGYLDTHRGPVANIADFISAWTGDADFDTVGDAISLASTNRENKVQQEFQKKLSAIDYQIQRQELNRQDIRDLVEVTTGRMDIFLLTGTFLLTFCLEWFSSSRLFDGGTLPPWFVNLFLISNFNAVGYLLLCVWLAMHAAIASHSLGARLLINYQRLAIPTVAQLERIYVPFFPKAKTQKLVQLARKLGFIPKDDEPPAQSFSHEENNHHSWTNEKGADEQHFRRFLQAQQKWLAYDAYARVCLTLGMNQMLHALSYYVVGELGSNGSIAGTVFVFFGVKLLSLAVMKLDVTGGITRSEVVLVVICTVCPSMIAAILLFFPIPLHPTTKALMATPCFILHLLANRLMRHNIRPVEHHGLELPRMLRTVGYLNIIGMTQRSMVNMLRHSDAWNEKESLKAARLALEKKMISIQQKEETTGAVSARLRRTAEVNDLQKMVNQKVGLVRDRFEEHDFAEAEIPPTEYLLNRFALWQKAPELLAMFQALRADDIHRFAEDEDRKALEKGYHAFLEHCRELDLGIAWAFDVESAGSTTSKISNSTANTSGSANMKVAIDETPKVRVDMKSAKGHKVSAWHCPATGEWSFEPRDHGTVVSVSDALGVVIPDWTARVTRANDASGTLGESDRTASGLTHRSHHSMNRLEFQIPKDETQADEMPSKLTFGFSKAMAVWWSVAIIVHVVMASVAKAKHYAPVEEDVQRRLRSLSSTWPEPAAFFQVVSLHCNSSLVLVSDRTSMYSTHRLSDESLGPLVKLSHSRTIGTVCDSLGCDALTASSTDSSKWELAPLPHPIGSNRSKAFLSAQHSWRHVSVAWHAGMPSESIRLAGWDGSEVTVIDFQKDAESSSWIAQNSFALHPGVGRCSASLCPQTSTQYTKVHALQLSLSGQSLQILLGDGFLDSWDLSTGTLKGRWLHDNHTAMCHDNKNLLLARRSKNGPVLETAPLPLA